MTLDTALNPIAVYAAALSTLVAGWNFYQWWTTGPKLAVQMIANQKFRNDKINTFVFIAIANRGNAETTITGLNLFAYKNLLGQLRNKGKMKIVPIHCEPNAPLPHRLPVGHEFNAYLVQDDALEGWSNDHRAFICVSHSMSNKPLMKRLSPIRSGGTK